MESQETVALLRAYDKATGADAGNVEMPAKQTGSPMSYMHNGKQYIVLAVTHAGANAGGELIAYALPWREPEVTGTHRCATPAIE